MDRLTLGIILTCLFVGMLLAIGLIFLLSRKERLEDGGDQSSDGDWPAVPKGCIEPSTFDGEMIRRSEGRVRRHAEQLGFGVPNIHHDGSKS